MSNLVPTWTGNGVTPTGTAGTAGSLATGTYVVQITGQDIQNQYESQIYTAAAGVAVTGPNGSMSIVLPSLPGYTFSVYISVAGGTTPVNLALSAAGPTSGPLQGVATQLASGSTVVVTGIGPAQVPPAAPATGITVYPSYIFGRGAYAQVVLDEVKFTYLKDADKSDPINQLRIVGWKALYGTLIQNVLFAMRVESTTSFNLTFG
jgi:hypothetical protein